MQMDRRTALLFLGLGLASGCSKRRGPSAGGAPDIPSYPDGAEGLGRLWQDILTACQKDERQRVHDLMASMAMTEEELGSVIGKEGAKVLWPRYQQLIGAMVNVGAMELTAEVLDKKYDTAIVLELDRLPANELRANDNKTRQAVRKDLRLYAVRIRKKGAGPDGLRYNFFVYLDGKWKTGNQLAQHLDRILVNKGD